MTMAIGNSNNDDRENYNVKLLSTLEFDKIKYDNFVIFSSNSSPHNKTIHRRI